MQRRRRRNGGRTIVERRDVGNIGTDRGVRSGNDVDIGQGVARDIGIGANMMRGGRGVEVLIDGLADIEVEVRIDTDREERIMSQDEIIESRDGTSTEDHAGVDRLISEIVEGGGTR